MGTPQIGADILEGILASGIKIDTVITRPDKPKGRGGQISESPVKLLAKEKGLKIFQPAKKAELEEFVLTKKPDLIIVAAFGMILPKSVLDAPKHKAINVHPSLLPLYRGPAPIEAPILDGDEKTGVTIMLMSEGMDEGDILLQKEHKLTGLETAPELEKSLAKLSVELLTQVLPTWLAGEINPQKQDDTKATYTKMIQKENGKINLESETALQIERKSRALQPWPGIYTFWNGKKLDLFDITFSLEKIEPGKVTVKDGQLLIGTQENSIIVGSLKIEGKNKVTAQEFLRGYPSIINTKL